MKRSRPAQIGSGEFTIGVGVALGMMVAAVCALSYGLVTVDAKSKAEVLNDLEFSEGYRCAQSGKTLWQCRMEKWDNDRRR